VIALLDAAEVRAVEVREGEVLAFGSARLLEVFVREPDAVDGRERVHVLKESSSTEERCPRLERSPGRTNAGTTVASAAGPSSFSPPISSTATRPLFFCVRTRTPLRLGLAELALRRPARADLRERRGQGLRMMCKLEEIAGICLRAGRPLDVGV
jgi:hypothetical protein